MDEDVLMEKKILDGPGDDYKELVSVVRSCDTPITFDELMKNSQILKKTPKF